MARYVDIEVHGDSDLDAFNLMMKVKRALRSQWFDEETMRQDGEVVKLRYYARTEND